MEVPGHERRHGNHGRMWVQAPFLEEFCRKGAKMGKKMTAGAKITVAATLAAVCAVFLAGYAVGGRSCRPDVEMRTDTLVVVDTVTIREPEYVERTVVRTELVAVHDTVRLRDTLFVEVPVESRHYSDSLYDAWVSGCMASLDSIRVYPVTRYVTTERTVKAPERKRWCIGVQAGYGVGKGGPTPYVGVGISYDLIRF